MITVLRKKSFEKTNDYVRDLISKGINPYMYYINNKENKFHWFMEFYRFQAYLSKISPDFYMLWHIYGFIKHIELLYMYHDDDSSPIHTIKTKDDSSIRSFRICNSELDFYIEYTLYIDDGTISIKLKRLWGSTISSEMSFVDSRCKLESRTDEILMYNIIKWTMEPVRDLFLQYYKVSEAGYL
jgi:hypothetical protein